MKGRRASSDWQPAPSRRLAAAGPRDRDLSVVEQNCSGGSRPGRAKPIKHRKNCTCRGVRVVASCGQPALAGTCTVGVGRTSRRQARRARLLSTDGTVVSVFNPGRPRNPPDGMTRHVTAMRHSRTSCNGTAVSVWPNIPSIYYQGSMIEQLGMYVGCRVCDLCVSLRFKAPMQGGPNVSSE